MKNPWLFCHQEVLYNILYRHIAAIKQDHGTRLDS